MKDFYMVTSRYDMVAVVEAPDDVTLAKAVLTLGSQGSVTSEMLCQHVARNHAACLGGRSALPAPSKRFGSTCSTSSPGVRQISSPTAKAGQASTQRLPSRTQTERV